MIILVDFNSRLDGTSFNDRNFFSSVNLIQLLDKPTRVDYEPLSLLDRILISIAENTTSYNMFH